MNYRRIHKTSYVYLKRSIFWRRNSQPFISGDLFADQADVNFYSPKLRGARLNLEDVRNARVIFCPSHRLEELLEQYGNLITAKVLILGNSDRDFDFFDFDLPQSIRTVFAQNLNFFDRKINVLPIGLENVRLGVNGTPWLFNDKMITDEKKNKVLIGPFSFTHSERIEFQSLQSGQDLEVVTRRMSPNQYAKFSSHYHFIAAPRGNGLDTHRFWEAIYRGSFPIVKKNNWSALVSKLDIPVLEVESFSSDSLSQIVKDFHHLNLRPDSIKSLWWPYWRDEIRKCL